MLLMCGVQRGEGLKMCLFCVHTIWMNPYICLCIRLDLPGENNLMLYTCDANCTIVI